MPKSVTDTGARSRIKTKLAPRGSVARQKRKPPSPAPAKRAAKNSKLRTAPSARSKSSRQAISLSEVATSKEFYDRFKALLNIVVEKGRSVEVKGVGSKTVAILAPRHALPPGMIAKRTLVEADLTQKKIAVGETATEGPYIINRHEAGVAVLFAPLPLGADRLMKVLDGLEELRLLDEARTRRATLIERAGKMIRSRIELLRNRGEEEGALQIERSLRAIEQEEQSSGGSIFAARNAPSSGETA